MMALCSFLLNCFNIANSDVVAHTSNGTQYGNKGVQAYVESNHGPDGQLFLDPYFKKDLDNSANKKVLDAGCGAAPWSIYAAQQGGLVYGIDIQEGMISAAKKAVESANLNDRVSLSKGDVSNLPFESDFFDKQISICVGCNLPPEIFDRHFSEFRRTLKNDGTAIIGAPNNLDIVFTNGSTTDSELQTHIQNVLNQLPDNPSSELISDSLMQLNEVLSATFYMKENRLSLLTNQKILESGQKIWRKLPKVVVPNRFYSKDDYLKVFKKYNFIVESTEEPHFRSKKEWIDYNDNNLKYSHLGKQYIKNAPFVIYHIKKGSEKSQPVLMVRN